MAKDPEVFLQRLRQCRYTVIQNAEIFILCAVETEDFHCMRTAASRSGEMDVRDCSVEHARMITGRRRRTVLILRTIILIVLNLCDYIIFPSRGFLS